MTSSVLTGSLKNWNAAAVSRSGTVKKISMLLETAKGIMNAYECCLASSRNVNAIFGAVDYCRDMRVKLTSEAVEQMWGRAKMAIAARAAGIVAIDAPFVAYQGHPGLRTQRDGRQADGL